MGLLAPTSLGSDFASDHFGMSNTFYERL